jgi:hypothetical protein
VSPVKYELGFYISVGDILHSDRRDNNKSYIALWTTIKGKYNGKANSTNCRGGNYVQFETLNTHYWRRPEGNEQLGVGDRWMPANCAAGGVNEPLSQTLISLLATASR